MGHNSNHNNNNNNSPDDFYFRQLQQTNGNYDAAKYDIGENNNSGIYDNDNDFDDYIRAMENKLNIHSSR